jgi:hypothetical protein
VVGRARCSTVNQFANPNAQTLCPVDAADSGIGGFVGEPPHGGSADVDGRGCKVLLFEEKTAAKDNGSVNGRARFGTVLPDGFVDGMTVGFLRAGRCERVQDGILRLLQVGQAKYGSRFGAF